MLRELLAGGGISVRRLHVAALMKLTAINRRPNTQKPAPGHSIYPHLLRKLPVMRPNHDCDDVNDGHPHLNALHLKVLSQIIRSFSSVIIPPLRFR
jgi:hypothetical protein